MRSLEEWTRYLERQEQALKKNKRTAVREEHLQEQAESERETVEEVSSDALRSASVSKSSSQMLEPPVQGRKPSSKRATVRKRDKEAQAVDITGAEKEVAQNSYKPFKETREQLLERLLDPVLTLEEAARILNVCPTTVRRYTNRNLLRHYRTAGNQRRFKLSDVLEFLEKQGRMLEQ